MGASEGRTGPQPAQVTHACLKSLLGSHHFWGTVPNPQHSTQRPLAVRLYGPHAPQQVQPYSLPPSSLTAPRAGLPKQAVLSCHRAFAHAVLFHPGTAPGSGVTALGKPSCSVAPPPLWLRPVPSSPSFPDLHHCSTDPRLDLPASLSAQSPT